MIKEKYLHSVSYDFETKICVTANYTSLYKHMNVQVLRLYTYHYNT